MLSLHVGYGAGLYLFGTSLEPVFDKRKVRAEDFYHACVGRKVRGKFESSDNQHGHLIL